MSHDMSFLRLILDASLIVQIVMALLLLASIASWAVMFEKRRVINRARITADRFEKSFWSGGDLNRMFKGIRARKAEGIEEIFEGGFSEFGRLAQEEGVSPAQVMEGTRRAMQVSKMREMERLEHNLAFLATVGSTSPYLGLFGTVWGIMNAFRALGNVQHATLAMVAPGIAEALIATAMGLFAAIPAVVAYNRYADKVDRLESRYEAFTEEFSTILQRHSRSKEAA